METAAAASAASSVSISPVSPPQELSQVVIEGADRFSLPLAEFDRVLAKVQEAVMRVATKGK